MSNEPEERRFTRLDSVNMQCEGQIVLNFATPDLLGLSFHPEVHLAARQVMDQSGLLGGPGRDAGRSEWHARLEAALACWRGQERGLLFDSEIAALAAVTEALAEAGADCLAATPLPWDWRLWNRRCRDAESGWKPVAPGSERVVVAAAVIEETGARGDLRGALDAAREQGAALIVDDRGGAGVLGENGCGGLDAVGARGAAALELFGLGGIGAAGAGIVGSGPWIERVGATRSAQLAEALPAYRAAAALKGLEILGREPLVAKLGSILAEFAAQMDVGATRSSARFVFPAGSETAGLAAALLDDGYFVGVRGQGEGGRIFVQLSAAHEKAEVVRFSRRLRSVGVAAASVL